MKTQQLSGVIRIKKQGSPVVMEYTQENLANPGPDEVLIKQQAIAINFVDVMFRNGTFPIDSFPATIGVEAAGTVENVGANVSDFLIGDRVAYYFSLGAYAERRLINKSNLILIPNDISFDQAASIMAKGLTARMLVKQAYPIKANDVVLVHAAAGGVGSLVAKWAKSLGAIVIGTVGSAAKKEIALSFGLDLVVAIDTESLQDLILPFTNNKGVDVVYDGVGKATFEKALPAIANGATIVLYGSASGEPQINAGYLASKQIKLLRPSLGQYLNGKHSVDTAASELFQAVRSGVLGEIKPTIYTLAQVAQAHEDLESSKTTGSLVLHPF